MTAGAGLGVMSEAKEHQQSSEAERGKNRFFLRHSRGYPDLLTP